MALDDPEVGAILQVMVRYERQVLAMARNAQEEKRGCHVWSPEDKRAARALERKGAVEILTEGQPPLGKYVGWLVTLKEGV